MFRAAVVSLFPEMFSALCDSGVTGRALTRKLAEIKCFNPRDYTEDKHRTVDDRPYGGGPGMVMKVAPLALALAAARQWLNQVEGGNPDLPAQAAKVIYLSPQGRQLDRALVTEIGQSSPPLILVAGRYEGIDERFIESEVDDEISIGDYVLSGGELPAMVMLDALIRRLPNVLGDGQSAEQDSFENGLLDCPHYTRPEVLNDRKVPDVLLSGDHKKIDRWRHKQALGKTSQRRPDLLSKIELTDAQKTLLEEYRGERK